MNSDSTLRLPISLDPLPEHPLVSVLIANYNGAAFIGEAVESVLNQTYTNVEVVVCDDGSADDSCAIVAAYAACDPRVRLLRHATNQGQGAAWNTARPACRGEIICLLDADDTYLVEKVAMVVAAFRASPRAGLLVHPLMLVDEAGRELQPMRFLPRHEVGWIADHVIRRGGRWDMMPGGGLSIRRELLDYVFPVPAAEFRGHGDGFIATLAPLVTEVARLDEPLYRYRLHGQNDMGSLVRDEKMTRKEMIGIETQVRCVNVRLAELGLDALSLDLARNLNHRQQQVALALYEGASGLAALRAYLAMLRALAADDLYGPFQKLVRAAVFGLAILLPLRYRRAWLDTMRSRGRLRAVAERVQGGLTRAIARAWPTSSRWGLR